MVTYSNILLLLCLGCIVLIFFLVILRRFFQPKLDPVLSAFFEKYALNDASDAEIDHKLKEIGNINSDFPDEDKRVAQALIRFKNQLNINK